MNGFRLHILILLAITFICCESDESPMDTGIDLNSLAYNPIPYEVVVPSGFIGNPSLNYPALPIPEDNPMTEAGVDLGRHLFYDPVLSADNSMSCAGCHNQGLAFTDGLKVSPGIDGITGTRSSMSLVDIGFNTKGLFWDGRVLTLEEQALLPVEDPIELHHSWPDVEQDLREMAFYREKFRAAFGISNSNEITRELAVKAIAQFERSMISSGNSKFDRVNRGELSFSDEELLGESLFFDLNDGSKDAECNHCHQPPLFTSNLFLSNGLENVSSYDDFPDRGHGEVTGVQMDIGRFRVPTLRNIEFSAPYMHDGRFETLEEVIEHYNSGGHFFENIDPNMRPLDLNEEEKCALIAFLLTLSDQEFMENEKFSNPF